MDDHGNGFTNKEILIRLEAKMDYVIADHEKRLRGLERFRYAFPSVAFIALGVSILGLLLTNPI